MHSLENRSAASFELWLRQRRSEQNPFVLFRPPGASLLSCYSTSQSSSPKPDFEFVFAPFDRKAKVLRLVNPEGFQVECSPVSTSKNLPITRLESPGDEKDHYIRSVQKIKEAIERGDVSKVVLSRAIHLSLQRDPWSVFKRLLFMYAKACCYWWYHPDSGHWMGATPEELLTTAQGKLQVMSLAGTLPADTAAATGWSSKEKEEQAMVTRYIEKILTAYGSPVHKEGPTTVQAGNLVHLRTLLSIALDGDLSALLEELHPTPAVCGLPAHEAASLIEALEPHDREYYTGYFGFTSGQPLEDARLYVNLRCLKWTPSAITVFVGGGITAESDAEKEWQETVEKSHTILNALDIKLD